MDILKVCINFLEVAIEIIKKMKLPLFIKKFIKYERYCILHTILFRYI